MTTNDSWGFYAQYNYIFISLGALGQLIYIRLGQWFGGIDLTTKCEKEIEKITYG